MGLVERRHRLLQAFPPAAIQIDDRPDAGGVHLGEVAFDSLFREGLLAASQVVMDIDHRKPGLLNDGFLPDQHWPRSPVPQLQLANVVLRQHGRRRETGDNERTDQQPAPKKLHGSNLPDRTLRSKAWPEADE